MRVAYIAGPYRSKEGVWGIVNNIRAAETIALKYWRLGYAVICPHKNTALFDNAAPDDIWLAGDIEILKRCDVVVAMTTWEASSGARAEIELAKQLGIEIIYDNGDLS